MKQFILTIGSLVAMFAAAQQVEAGILISNWNLSTNSLTFNFSGSIPPTSSAGPEFPNVFYIGDGSASNVGWVTNFTSDGTFVENAGDDGLVSIVVANSDDLNGDWASVRINESFVPFITSNDFFDIDVRLSGVFDPAAIDFADVEVALGFDRNGQPFFPDADFIVGGAVQPTEGTVPEPTSLAIFGVGALGLSGVRRRRKVKVDLV